MMLTEQSIKNESHMTTKTTTLLDKLARTNHIQNSILFHGPNLDNIQTEISYFIEKSQTLLNQSIF